jgi:hypothetical protein
MSNALAVLDQRPAMPAHISTFLDEAANIRDRVTVPSLGYTGKVWAISVNGETTKLTKRNEDGDEEPLGIMRVVVLDYNQRRGRSYYEGNYDPSKTAAPACWSEDGVAPSSTVKTPQASKCGECPLAVKGSKINDNGKPTTACSQHRMVAVVPANQLDFPPLRLKLAITSDYDGQSPELEQQGWFGFSNYTDLLRARGVKHTAALVTKMRFDPNVAYPKVMFGPDRWLTEQEMAAIVPVVKGDTVKQLLAGTWQANGIDAEPLGDETPVSAVTTMPTPAPTPAPAAPKAAPKAPAARPKAAAPAPAPVTIVEDEDEQLTLPLPGGKPVPAQVQAAPAPAKAPAPAPVSTDIPDDLATLLGEWDD